MEKGGEFDLTDIRWFNGGLFDGRRALALQADEIGLLIALHSFRWDLIDPTIFGTLFERFLDPDKRAQIGAHYTDPDKIMMIVEPVVLRPLVAEWEAAKAEIAALLAKKRPDRARALARREAFVDRLCALRILDPACGSGNFLYLALQGVKDLEYRALLECETMGLPGALPRVSPRILHGLEINPLAAELARTVIWIGDIQWGIRNALAHRPEPILEKLDAIECRDALLNEDGSEALWPEADFIVGNPPFLGGKKLRDGLGDSYVETLFAAYAGEVSAEADLVCYWFVKAWAAAQAGRVDRVGLVSTNSIRGGANRRALAPIAEAGAIFEAWSDEPWVIDGAAVRVSLICFAKEPAQGARLDGAAVSAINADLSGGGCDLTKAVRLLANRHVASNGVSKKGKFEISGSVARAWIKQEYNANGQSNHFVLKPWQNGDHLMGAPFADLWIINFSDFDKDQAAFFQAPFEYVSQHVRPFRERSRSLQERNNWWKLARPASALFLRLKGKSRAIVVAEVAKHRVFAWMQTGICPDKNLVVISRDDDTTFGILHSRFHEAWSLRLGTSLEDRPRYTPTTTFETFPFPEGLTPDIPAADYASDPRAQRIAAAAKRLDDLRRAWLNPPDLVEIVPEVVPGYPDRILPKNVEAAAKLKARTLTALYNQRPQWLADAHEALDRAVAAAYGWPEDISADDALAKLLALNLERAAAQEAP
jgi:type II restriction/modification system DNA methylase subunit YeeA